MRLILLLLSISITGCSFVLTRGGPYDLNEPVDCTWEIVAPVLDGADTASLIFAGLASEVDSDQKIYFGVAAISLASTIYGAYNKSACKNARSKQFQRLMKFRGQSTAGRISSDIKAKTKACRQSSSCAEDGSCAYENGKCAPAKAFHCKMSNQCRSSGHCSLKDGRCQAVETTDCSESLICKSKGLCVVSNGECVAGK